MEYLAGFIDGEGAISFSKMKYNKAHNNCGKGYSYLVHISIGNTDKQILEAIKSSFGGVLTHRSNTKHPNWKPFYALDIRAKKAKTFLKKLLPHLIMKRRQAELVLESENHFRNIDAQEYIYNQMKILNHRGA